jgi:hypothetical protein
MPRMIIFKKVTDLSHNPAHVFQHAFIISAHDKDKRWNSKKALRKAILEFMVDFGPVGERWVYALTSAYTMSLTIRFKSQGDAMLFKLIT